MTGMNDIGEFADRAATQFLEAQAGIHAQFSLQLARSAVTALVREVYYASLIPDEGRYPTVCLMSYRKGCEAEFHLLFNAPVPPKAEEIAKLAHAVAPESHLCCLCDKGQIHVAGIHVTTLNEIRELGYSSSRVGNPLKLMIRGPGHIEISTGGIAFVYKFGHITEERLFQYSRVMEALAASVKTELADLTVGTVEAIGYIFNDLAKAIVRLRHGGILIVAKEPKRSQFSSLLQVDSLLLQQLLVRYWNDVAAYLAESGGVGKLLASASRSTPHALAVASDTAMLEKCVYSIAHLAGMDGAIVLTYDCKVAAFNAMIGASETEQASGQFVDQDNKGQERDMILKHRGTRHRSALAYATKVPDSFALAISQDGGISAFYNQGDGKVMCETGMRVLD
jgi:hypothetical protein